MKRRNKRGLMALVDMTLLGLGLTAGSCYGALYNFAYTFTDYGGPLPVVGQLTGTPEANGTVDNITVLSLSVNGIPGTGS